MWQTVDYFTGELIDVNKSIRFINEIIDHVYYYARTIDNSKLLKTDSGWYNKERFSDKFIFDKSNGKYRVITELSIREEILCKYGSTEGYIYKFNKEYAATKHLRLFKDRQVLIDEPINFKLSNFLKYSIGVEYETSSGIIPEDICFRDGLIPLRDGSIGGNEYSSIVLEGNNGLNLLKQQINTLQQYTYFDKNCSLHFHFGGFKLTSSVIYNIYLICIKLQNELEYYLPPLTFRTHEYKDTGKDYCNKLPTNLRNFDSFYKYMVGKNFFGDLYQPHPSDLSGERKWQIHQRYYFINFINSLCYKRNKTIEFRFLRPTYNFNKIIFWLYIFNAIIVAAEHGHICTDLRSLIYTVYPREIAQDLERNIVKLAVCRDIQTKLGDMIGSRLDVEDRIFNTSELI